MSNSTNTNIFETAYHASVDIIEQIKIAYSTPKNCVSSYWCLIPMILLILIGIVMLLSIYYYFVTIVRTCCCCFLCKPSTRFARAEPTVVVQPAVIPSYPVYSYKDYGHRNYGYDDHYFKNYGSKDFSAWRPHKAEIRHRTDACYDSPSKSMLNPVFPQKSPSEKKLLEFDKQTSRVLPADISYDEMSCHFSSDLPLELSSIYDKENSRDFWENYEVESPSKDSDKQISHRKHLSEFSVNSIFGCYTDLSRQSSNISVKRIKSGQYMDNTTSRTGVLNGVENICYSPDIYNKTRVIIIILAGKSIFASVNRIIGETRYVKQRDPTEKIFMDFNEETRCPEYVIVYDLVADKLEEIGWKYALISMDYDGPELSFMDDSYESKLDGIINDLNLKILWQTDFLQKFEAFTDIKTSNINQHEKAQREMLSQIKHRIDVYEEYSRTMDFTIDDTLLTNLLARRKIQKNTIEAELALEMLKKKLKNTFFLIEREKKILEDSRIIGSLLDKKLKVLEKKNQRNSQEILNECYMGVKEVERSVNKFMRELVRFIDEELGDVLLAEQSGTFIGYADLAGKKHITPLAKPGQTTLDKHIFAEQKDRISLCNSTKELLENLMNRSVLSGEDPYLVVEDSVVGRVLLRSGLVMLHSKDATKMRLVEFHKEINEPSFI
ncbi:hypothetical protein PMAC_001687 [Pneumocystis sp. 'macacae']|nr:hypothetical protein PMAC_001687 [Pneumocystis sp. 'macacae']